jgi:hypothetical protein
MQRIVGLLVLALLVSGGTTATPAGADDEEKTPRTRLEHFRAEMEKIRFHLINVGAKVKGGVASMGRRDEKTPDTPANRCCAVNVTGLEKHLTNLVGLWQDLNACYEAESDAEAQIQLNFVRQDAGSLVRAYENFRGAKENQLLGGQQAMVKGFFLLEESMDELVECGEKIVRN